MARARGGAPAAPEAAKPSAEERTANMFAGYVPGEKKSDEATVPPAAELPIEKNLSEMLIAVEKRGYRPGLAGLAAMPVLARHMIAAWIVDLNPGEPPKCLEKFKEPTTARDIPATPATAAAQAKLMEATFPKAKHATTTEPVLRAASTRSSISNATSVRVSWGGEKYGVRGEYSTFESPSFEFEVALGDQEDPVVVAEKVLAEMEKLAAKAHEKKLAYFLSKLGIVHEAFQGGGSR